MLPGDLGVGDLLPAPPDDARLVPAASLEGDDGLADWGETAWAMPGTEPEDLVPVPSAEPLAEDLDDECDAAAEDLDDAAAVVVVPAGADPTGADAPSADAPSRDPVEPSAGAQRR